MRLYRRMETLLARLLLFGSASTGACGGTDDFPPPNGSAAQGATAGTTVQQSYDELVVEACTSLCEQRLDRGCSDVPESADQCANYCSFFSALTDDCQRTTYEAYQCQLDNNPCSTSACNELLKAAEAACPDWSFLFAE